MFNSNAGMMGDEVVAGGFNPDTDITWWGSWIVDASNVDDTAAVGQWDDTSGNQRHFLATDKPQMIINQINGHPSIKHDGIGNYMESDALGAYFSGYVVVDASVSTLIYCLSGSGSNARTLYQSGTQYRFWDNNYLPIVISLGWHYIRFEAIPGQIILAVDGGTPVTHASPQSWGTLRIATNPIMSVFSALNISELRIKESQFTENQITDMDAHLSERYAL